MAVGLEGVVCNHMGRRAGGRRGAAYGRTEAEDMGTYLSP